MKPEEEDAIRSVNHLSQILANVPSSPSGEAPIPCNFQNSSQSERLTCCSTRRQHQQGQAAAVSSVQTVNWIDCVRKQLLLSAYQCVAPSKRTLQNGRQIGFVLAGMGRARLKRQYNQEPLPHATSWLESGLFMMLCPRSGPALAWLLFKLSMYAKSIA